MEELPCIGDRPAWSWMNSGGAPRDLFFSKFPAEDVILHLALLEQEGTAHPLLKVAADKDLQLMLQQMFIDTHNTGFYVNMYTTKMGVGMAEFMKHLRAGIERVVTELNSEDQKLAAEAKIIGSGPKSVSMAKRVARILLRINTSYTRCKHIGGAELVFPIVFGHLCYGTHKTWNVWTKTAVWRALESWRRSCGSLHVATSAQMEEPQQMVHAVRGKLDYLPTDWVLDGETVKAPDGSIYDSVHHAQEAFFASQAMLKHVADGDLKALLAFLNASDVNQEVLEVDGAIVTSNQLDDYNYRGEHPLLAPMSLYVYSMWVHKVERSMETSEPSHVRLPFNPSYKLASG